MGIGIVDGGLGIGFWDWAVGRSRSGWAKWKGSTEGRGSEMEEDNRHHRRHADHAIKKYKQNVKTQIQNINTNTKHKYKHQYKTQIQNWRRIMVTTITMRNAKHCQRHNGPRN